MLPVWRISKQVTWAEARVYAVSRNNGGRVVHFKTSDASVINYLTKGTGSIDATTLRRNFTPLTGHKASLPVAANSSESVALTEDNAATQLLLSGTGKHGDVNLCAGCTISGVGNKWCVDDACGTGATIHRIWLRTTATAALTPSFQDKRSCQAIKEAYPNAQSGPFNIQLHSTLPVMRVHCDFESDGSAWMLVLNYLQNTLIAPPALVRADPPLKDSDSLSVDESHNGGYNGTWGHAPASVLAKASLSI